MAQRAWCETVPQAAVQISNGSLTYAQPHPRYPDAPMITCTATVTNDSKFAGTSDRDGTITGQNTSTDLTGTLTGVGCSYTLDAERR
jgi:hypothetical protein